MIETCRKTIKQTDCGHELKSQHPAVYPEFSVCLPFGRTLVWDGTGLRLRGQATVRDGQYGLITVEGGCITNAQEQPACEYTPAPCTPAAAPCGEGGAAITLKPGLDNLLSLDPQGRLGVTLSAEGENGVTVSGKGTAADPLKISYDLGANDLSTHIKAGNDAIQISGTGTATDSYTIAHKEISGSGGTVFGPGTYGGFTIDNYGHVTGYTETGGSVTEIIGKTGITVTKTGSVVTLGVPMYANVTGDYRLGAYNLHVESYGTVSAIERAYTFDTRTDSGSAEVPEFREIDTRFNTVTVDAYGAVRGVSAIPDAALQLGVSFTEPQEAERDVTMMTFTTKTSGYFRIRYEGYLDQCVTAAKYPGEWETLPRTWQLKIDNKKVMAYGRGCSTATQVTEVFTVSDAMYGAGTHTVQLVCTIDEYRFRSHGFLTVDVISRGGDADSQ